jgi:hypothetical protein
MQFYEGFWDLDNIARYGLFLSMQNGAYREEEWIEPE